MSVIMKQMCAVVLVIVAVKCAESYSIAVVPDAADSPDVYDDILSLGSWVQGSSQAETLITSSIDKRQDQLNVPMEADKRMGSLLRYGKRSGFLRIGRDGNLNRNSAQGFLRIGRSEGLRTNDQGFLRIGRGDNAFDRSARESFLRIGRGETQNGDDQQGFLRIGRSYGLDNFEANSLEPWLQLTGQVPIEMSP